MRVVRVDDVNAYDRKLGHLSNSSISIEKIYETMLLFRKACGFDGNSAGLPCGVVYARWGVPHWVLELLDYKELIRTIT
jgi:hypothetical protein